MRLNLTHRLLDSFGFDGAAPGLLRAYSLSALAADRGESPSLRLHRLSLAALRAVIDELDQSVGDGAPWILLKGEPLEERLFGRELARSTGDVDLLVLPGDLEFFRDRLAGLGYFRGQQPRMWAHNQEAWTHVEHRAIIELHWSPALPGVPTPPLHELFETAVPFRFPNGANGRRKDLTVTVLRDDWLFAHLALHFHHHFGFAKGLLDIAGWCDRLAGRVDLPALAADLKRVGMWGIAQWPLHTISRLTGEVPPLFDPAPSAPVRALAAASARAMDGCLRRAPRSEVEASLVSTMPLVGPWRGVPMQAATMLVLDDWSTRARGVLQPVLLGPHRVGRMIIESNLYR